MTPTHSKWNSYPSGIRNSIETLDVLRVVLLRPAMLSVARHFSPKEAEMAFRLFVRWSVRLFIVGGGRSGTIEEAYAKSAEAITSGNVKTAKELSAAMDDFLPTDGEFGSAFATARVAQSYLARYYLRALELKLTGQTEPEWVPNDQVVINLEHVLPENSDTNWPNIDAETASALYKRIGNLVLLQASQNALLGNSPFADKKAILKQSGFLLTQEVAKQRTWGAREIVDRQKRLAALAVETWPLTIT